MVGQILRKAYTVTQAWSPLHENIQSCQPKSRFTKRVPFLWHMIEPDSEIAFNALNPLHLHVIGEWTSVYPS